MKPQPVVVICTGYANMSNARQALMMRVHYLATKPVELDELKSNLARLIAIRANTKGTIKLAPPNSTNKTALIVHGDMTAVSSLQSAFVQNGITAIVPAPSYRALGITQHYFDVAVVSSRISEEGDGWSLGGVIRLVFPSSFVLMIAPGTDLMTLKNANQFTASTRCWRTPPLPSSRKHRPEQRSRRRKRPQPQKSASSRYLCRHARPRARLLSAHASKARFVSAHTFRRGNSGQIGSGFSR